MNVFNLISAGGGSGSGLYIWKKSEYIPSTDIVNPSFTLELGYSAYMTNANFDLSLIPLFNGIPYANASGTSKVLADFFEGFVADNTNRSSFYIDYSTRALKFNVNGVTKYDVRAYCYEGSTNRYYVSLGGNTSGTLNMSYNGTKTLPAKVGDFIDFVISDKEDAYPDKEVKDGFYYEKFSEMDFGDMNITRISVGEITPASATTSMTINHNLGVAPKFAYVWTDDTLINQYSIYKYACSFRSPQYLGICALWNMGYSIANTAITQNYTVNSFYTGDIYVSGTYAAFEAKKKYKYVVLA